MNSLIYAREDKQMLNKSKESHEAKFLFLNEVSELAYISDSENQRLGFGTSSRGNKVVVTQDSNKVTVLIEYFADGSKVYHMEQDSKGLPAMHEFAQDGSETIYLFNSKFKLEKLVENLASGNKVTHWFSACGTQIVTQEQRQREGIVFKADFEGEEATIWLQKDGSIKSSGPDDMLDHLQSIFGQYLDGLALGV
jgi:hypothetical protein